MPTVPSPRRLIVNVLALVAAVAAALAISIAVSPGGGRTIEAAGTDLLGAGGEFHAVTPTRIFDSRKPELDVAPTGIKPTGPGNEVVFDVPIAGLDPLPAWTDDGTGHDANVLAVVATVAVIAPTQRGHLTMYPTGETPDTTAVNNYEVGQIVTNSAVLRPGKDGKVSIHLFTNAPGTAHMIIDVTGWFSTSAYPDNGARVVPIEPTRIFDTNLGQFGGANLVGTRVVDVDVLNAVDTATGAPLIPVADRGRVVGVVLNLTGVNAFGGSVQTHMSIVPDPFDVNDDAQWPSTVSINLAKGQTRGAVSILPLGTDGKVRLFSLQGETRAVIDVTGYLVTGADPSTRAGRVIPLKAPFRAFDTRDDTFFDQPLGPANAEPWSFSAFAGDVKVDGEAVGAQSALIGNLAAFSLQPSPSWQSFPERSHMTVYPADVSKAKGECADPPTIANVNYTQSEVVPNMALLRYGSDARVCVFNLDGYVDYLLDVYAIVLAES